jgi:hypothetical protein
MTSVLLVFLPADKPCLIHSTPSLVPVGEALLFEGALPRVVTTARAPPRTLSVASVACESTWPVQHVDPRVDLVARGDDQHRQLVVVAPHLAQHVHPVHPVQAEVDHGVVFDEQDAGNGSQSTAEPSTLGEAGLAITRVRGLLPRARKLCALLDGRLRCTV